MKFPRAFCTKFSAALGLFSLVFVLPVAGQAPAPILGPDGAVYKLHAGTYGELFPEGAQASAENPVLALDILRSGGPSERWLVPGTAPDDVDDSPAMVYESTTGQVYLLWQTLYNSIHPLIYLTSFNGTQFSENIEVVSAPFAHKGSLQLRVTRERPEPEPGPEPESKSEDRGDRTILHVAWWEDAAAGASQKRYTAIILENGRYLGWSPVIDLSELFAGEPNPSVLEIPGLEDALRIQAGRSSSLVIGFLDPADGRLKTYEIEAVPWGLSDLAEKIRAQIIAIGSRLESREDFAARAREMVLFYSKSFHDATRVHMAEVVSAAVASSQESPDALTSAGVDTLAGNIRAQIIAIGARIRIGGLDSSDDAKILEIGQTRDGGAPYHHLQISVIRDLEAPEVGGPARLFLSDTGRRVLVAWEEGDRVYYRESLDDGWTFPNFVQLSPELDRETVYRMLEQRVRAGG